MTQKHLRQQELEQEAKLFIHPSSSGASHTARLQYLLPFFLLPCTQHSSFQGCSVLHLLLFLLAPEQFICRGWFPCLFLFCILKLQGCKNIKNPAWSLHINISTQVLLLSMQQLFTTFPYGKSQQKHLISQLLPCGCTSFFFVSYQHKVDIITNRRKMTGKSVENQQTTHQS